MAQLNIYLSDNLIKAIKNKASKEDRSVSYTMARMVAKSLKFNLKKDKPKK